MPDNLIDAIKEAFQNQTVVTAQHVKLWLRLIPVHFFITYHKGNESVKKETLEAASTEMFKR